MKTIEEALKQLRIENIDEEVLDESQSSEIRDIYQDLSDFYNVDLAELVYGRKGFMKTFYPNGFDTPADIVFLEDKWNEFEKWVKDTKGIDFADIRRIKSSDLDEDFKPSYGELSWKLAEIIAAMNNEEAYYGTGWLYIWPDGESKEECLVDFGDKESYEDLKKAFKKIYTDKKYHDAGLYTDNQEIVDFAHTLDKEFGLPLIQNQMDIKESLTDNNNNNNDNNYRLQISVVSGLNADGIDISIFKDGKLMLKNSYRYGYNASYSRSFSDPDKPYVVNIIQDYISKYNITEDNFTVIAGTNVYRGEKMSNKDVEDFKQKYCGNLVFHDNGAKDVKAAVVTETAGGEANGMTIEDIAKKHNVTVEDIEKQLEIGIQIEQEHTSDLEHAKKIAMDHLVEFSDYYDRLVKMEKDAEEGKTLEEDIDYEKITKQIDSQPVTSIKYSRVWNPDFYLKKEPEFEEARNTIRKALQNSSLTPEEITLSVYGSIIRFNKNVKLDTAQMKTLVNKVLAKINPALKAEKLRSMAGKITFDITGYEYLKDHIAEDFKLKEETAENNFISIPRSSREFNNVIDKYYKKFGKHLQIDTMLYDNQSGKYYMYNDQTDYSLTTKRLTESALTAEIIEEKYSKEELDDMIGDVYNIRKIDNIFRRKKYDETRLFAHTVCINCGREKTVFLSNLINDPDKYGSCVCSDTNIEAKIDNIQDLYSGKKKLSNNTSGYTGVSFVKTFRGEPYNKWRAYIEIDGVRTYLGDFTSKAKAIKARKEAGEKGIKWYKDNRNKLMRDVRRRSKKYKTSKYRETQKTRKYKRDK